MYNKQEMRVHRGASGCSCGKTKRVDRPWVLISRTQTWDPDPHIQSTKMRSYGKLSHVAWERSSPKSSILTGERGERGGREDGGRRKKTRQTCAQSRSGNVGHSGVNESDLFKSSPIEVCPCEEFHSSEKLEGLPPYNWEHCTYEVGCRSNALRGKMGGLECMPISHEDSGMVRHRGGVESSHGSTESLSVVSMRTGEALKLLVRSVPTQAVASLITPRTLRRIFRLPPPGRNELKTLQHVEIALRRLSQHSLSVRAKSGLYSQLGRKGTDKIEADIQDLSAAISGAGQREVDEYHATLVQRIARNAGHVMSTLLSTQDIGPLPTAEPPCLQYTRPLSTQEGAELSWTLTLPSPMYSACPARLSSRGIGTKKHQTLQRKHEWSFSMSGGEVEIERNSRIWLAGVKDADHCKYVLKNITALREMLSREMLGDKSRLMGLGVLSVRERRQVDSARRRRVCSKHPASECTTGRACEGTLHHGNLIVREHARGLLESFQKRIQEGLLQMAFLKWKIALDKVEMERCLRAVVLIQTFIRGTLAKLEAWARRNLREDQITREKETVEFIVRRRKATVGSVVCVIRTFREKRRTAEERALEHATRHVQQAIRQAIAK